MTLKAFPNDYYTVLFRPHPRRQWMKMAWFDDEDVACGAADAGVEAVQGGECMVEDGQGREVYRAAY